MPLAQGHPFLRPCNIAPQTMKLHRGTWVSGYVTIGHCVTPLPLRIAVSAQCAVCSNHWFCPCALALDTSLKKNQTLQNIFRHIEEQQCGACEVELEDAVHPCTFLTQAYQHDHNTLTAKRNIVETQLEALGSSWSTRQVTTSMLAVPTQGPEKVMLLNIYQFG